MKKRLFNLTIISVNIFISCLSLNGYANNNQCKALFERTRGVVEPKTNWYNDQSYIETSQRKESLGQVATFFSKKWDTQIYYTKTAQPNIKGEVSLVDPESKGVFIFFHGSGTQKSGGQNFIGNLNTLANMGYSAISLDMPFHSEGPRSEAFNNSNHFMEWARSIILEAKKSGKPVYLAGHSFGPDAILELVTRYPKMVDGVVALSPAGFTKELSHWYDNYTTKMKFGGEVESNDDGGLWAGNISNQFLWHKSKLADPTITNPNLKVRIFSGNREEYVPAPIGGENNTPIGENTYDIRIPLKKIFKNAVVTVEPGIGHYIFDFQDHNGFNVVTRELLLVAGESPQNIKVLIEEQRLKNSLQDSSGVIGKKYVQDSLFKSWADQTYGNSKILNISKNNQDGLAAKILREYSLADEKRTTELFQRILNSKNEFPDFYEKYKEQIDKSNPKKTDKTLFVAFLNYALKNQK